MKVLLVSQHFWPESFRINEVVETLGQLGCEITVLTGQPNYPDGRTFPGFRWWGMGRQKNDRGLEILRVPLIPRGSAGAIRLILNYLSFIVSASLLGPWLLRGRQFDAIFVYGPSPILQVIPAILFKWIKRAPLLTWVQDLWPQSLEVTGFVRNRWLLARVASVVRWIYRRNDLLLVQSRAFIPEVESMSGGVEVRYHPNPGEFSLDKPMAADAVPLVRLEPGFNVLFAGNLGTVQALGTIVEAAELLRQENDIHIVLLGSGSRMEWAQSEISRRQLSNLRLAGRVPPEAVPPIFAQASALLVTLRRDPAMSQTVPSKIQAYLAAGIPVIACMDGEGARIVTEAGAGMAVPAEDAAALASAIRHLHATAPQERTAMGAAGRAYYRAHFDPATLGAQLIERFKEAARLRAARA
jgi:glycosyltransferase involved in cell wall biosynthesis